MRPPRRITIRITMSVKSSNLTSVGRITWPKAGVSDAARREIVSPLLEHAYWSKSAGV